ncbi:uveal autoantigen with coiled-coil domains and ankyrin repeats isoform X2 [Lonchura striata]|uniref:Uveal autoantigen with coiled-coil domains and ankyrin repeats n=1 Tax=Lonchura striata TaxID=40157 RepID=A0A218UD35_9PASE|nr:uveal autoantigen with coiled-coil domains and ankyrin repeats isoform X2 [Lonchura striata domestica]OWK51615.1 Uveal autoantigen with coiled-coil domains and ankyrin repeats [Lonchura striata domestica]
MKSLKSRLKKHEAVIGGSALNPDWSKYDDRLMKAAERGDVDKVSSILAKKGVSPTKLDVEGRSAFHVVASKGNLDCLNTILVHGVDITATDAAGRNALHLAAKYGHALCLQKLLQYNCPTENVDLQGRTALHDAAMSDCSASIQLLCDHGAAVNCKDGDGRTPLVLATQMCRPALCQLLLDRGADVNARDKQSRTALMLGCEYGCKDAVEVLLRNGADVALTDGLGHDCAYYARIGDNIDILALIKAALEDSSRGRDSMKRGQAEQKVTSVSQKWGRGCGAQEEPRVFQKEPSTQDLELENQDLKERMREVQEEQRMLLDRISGLQLQLSEKDELKKILTTKEKQQEESLRTIEALKAKLKYYEGDSAGSGGNFGNRKEDLLLKQGQAFAVESQSRSLLRPLELSLPAQAPSCEKEALKKELESLRSCLGAAKEEISKLQRELALKGSECRALASECERSKAESDSQVRQLEDALKDVQKRMFDSEGKVKQMQSHFLALKEHLASEVASGSAKVTEELKEQLREMKAKYEGASAEVGKLRNQIKQNELLVAEFQRDEGRLVEENKRLQKELVKVEMERDERGRNVTELEGQLRETAAKLAQSVSAEQFENMKGLLSGEVNEKAGRLAEVEGELEKLQAEVVLLQREAESQRAQLARHVKAEEHEQMRSGFEQREEELGKAISELSHKNETLQKELERLQADNKVLKQQVQMLKTEIKSQNVPLKIHEELKKANDLAVGDLTKKLFDITKKYNESKAEAEKLLAEKNDLNENISHLQAVYLSPEQHKKEVEALKSNGIELEKQLAELRKKYDEEQAKAGKLVTEVTGLRETLRDQYVLATTHEEVKTVLNSTLEKTNGELSDLKGKIGEIKQEFLRVNEENGALKNKVKLLQNQLKTEYISLKDHEATVNALNKSVQELQESNAALRAEHQRGQDEISQLHAEMEAQKKELDTIQECIKSKYAPVGPLEDGEQSSGGAARELRARLQEQEQRRRASEEDAQRCREENEKLRSGVLSIQKDLQQSQLLAEQSRRLERLCASSMEGLSRQLRALLGKLTGQEGRQDAAAAPQPPAGQLEALSEALGRTVEELQEALSRKEQRYREESLRVAELQRELARLQECSVPRAEFTRLQEGLQGEVAALRRSLREKEAESQGRSQEVLRLQAELQLSQRALAELRSQEVVAMAEYSSMKGALEAQVSSMAGHLASISHKYEQACEEALQARRSELSLKDEKELLQLRSCSIEQEIKDQKERCDKSLTTIIDLQKRIQESAKQVEAKDNKITELLNDVERLKQALNGLSQLTYTTGIPSKRHNQQVELLQSQVKTLQQQLADAARQHQEVVAVYRTHLLSAVQGHMDEDVQAALLQIIRMRQGLVC